MKYFFILLIIMSSSFAQDIEHGYEVKLFLKNDKVLKSGSEELNSSALYYFDIESKIKIVMEFLDAKDKELYSKRWIVRIRNREDKKKLEFTYKYRIKITSTIEEAFNQARKLGWDSGDVGKYKFEVDWGYNSQTLSISKKVKNIKLSGVDEEKLELPSGKQARDSSIKYMPGKLEKWIKKGWSKDIIKNAHIYGVVKGKRYIGTWKSNEVNIEVWNIAGTIITEVSFKTGGYKAAKNLRDELIQEMKKQKWLEEKSVLKTYLILSSY